MKYLPASVLETANRLADRRIKARVSAELVPIFARRLSAPPESREYAQAALDWSEAVQRIADEVRAEVLAWAREYEVEGEA